MVTRTPKTVGYTPTNDSAKTAVANYLLDHVGEWIDTATFEALGVSGSRRMRELRENGWSIKSRNAPGTRTRQHQLAKAPAKAIQVRYRATSKAATGR